MWSSTVHPLGSSLLVGGHRVGWEEDQVLCTRVSRLHHPQCIDVKHETCSMWTWLVSVRKETQAGLPAGHVCYVFSL